MEWIYCNEQDETWRLGWRCWSHCLPRPGQTPVCPWNDQDMVRGWSPGVTMQEFWAESPSLITSFAKENAPISGSSEHKNMIVRQYINCSLLSADWLDCQTNFLLNKHNAWYCVPFNSSIPHQNMKYVIFPLPSPEVCLPLTLSWAEYVETPAEFSALQV